VVSCHVTRVGDDLNPLLSSLSPGLSKDTFHFDAFSDGPARYNIIHFRWVAEKDKYAWIPVGEYNEGNLTLDMSSESSLPSHSFTFFGIQSTF